MRRQLRTRIRGITPNDALCPPPWVCCLPFPTCPQKLAASCIPSSPFAHWLAVAKRVGGLAALALAAAAAVGVGCAAIEGIHNALQGPGQSRRAGCCKTSCRRRPESMLHCTVSASAAPKPASGQLVWPGISGGACRRSAPACTGQCGSSPPRTRTSCCRSSWLWPRTQTCWLPRTASQSGRSSKCHQSVWKQCVQELHTDLAVWCSAAGQRIGRQKDQAGPRCVRRQEHRMQGPAPSRTSPQPSPARPSGMSLFRSIYQRTRSRAFGMRYTAGSDTVGSAGCTVVDTTAATTSNNPCG